MADLAVSPLRAGEGTRGSRGRKGPSGDKAGFVGIHSDRDGRKFVVIGLDSFRRAQAAGQTEIQVFDFGVMDPSDARVLVLNAHLGKEKVNPFATAKLLRDYAAENPARNSTRRLAEVFGTSHMTVSRYEGLWDLPAPALEAGLNGTLKPSHAYRALAIKDPAERQKAIDGLLGDRFQRKNATALLHMQAREAMKARGYQMWKQLEARFGKVWRLLRPEDRAKVATELKALTRRVLQDESVSSPVEVAHV